MDALKQYIFSIIVAATVCAIIMQFIGKKGANGALIKALCGMVMMVVLLSPVQGLSFSALPDGLHQIRTDAQFYAAEGRQKSFESIAAFIKRNTEAYILNKASAMHLDLQVEVTLQEDDIPVPSGVTITGNVSPYARAQLQTIISEDLGISKEDQTWI